MQNPTTAPTTGPCPKRPKPLPPTPRLPPPPRRTVSLSALPGLVLACGLLIGGATHAQIVHENPAQVKAANRRALRDAQHAESPYKDSHLDVTPARLRRGQSTQPQPEIRDELNYKNGTAPNVKSPGLLGPRRKRKR